MISANAERRALQGAILLFGCVPVAAGLAGAAGGGGFAGLAGDVSAQSHARYLSGLLLGIGLAFWASVPDIEAHARRIRLLAAIVVTGGLARLLGVALDGAPDLAMSGALVMELGVTPAIALWQQRVARRMGPIRAGAFPASR